MDKPGYAVAVLISGTGSNLKTLIDAGAEGRLAIRVSHTGSRAPCRHPLDDHQQGHQR
jgi:folate-dependent phosphoribosylglycinamide formyltransferase PurN